MTRYTLVCLLFGSLSWGQARSLRSGLTGQQPAVSPTVTAEGTAHDLKRESGISNVPLDKPLITITGLCDDVLANKSAASECKTVITRAQFEEVIEAIQPKMSPHARREFALTYADALVMTKKAEQMGLDKGENYEEQMKLARIQILSQKLKKVIQENASQISEKEIEDYYQNNMARFEKVEVDRVYVPKTQQTSASDVKLSDADRQKRSQESEQRMKEQADNLRVRAVAGEEFTKLQADAYQVAGIKSAAPNTSMGIRRASLSPTQVSVMDLKPGEVSPVLEDPNGYVIYRVKVKNTLPIDHAREEIKATLRSLRIQDEMRNIEDSATSTLDESYFAR
jgi:PPIC-type PPIASE domain